MGKYFGTDGFRGEANKDLTVEHAYKVGRYIGWYFGRNKDHAQVVIGKDTRRSSYMLEYALVPPRGLELPKTRPQRTRPVDTTLELAFLVLAVEQAVDELDARLLGGTDLADKHAGPPHTQRRGGPKTAASVWGQFSSTDYPAILREEAEVSADDTDDHGRNDEDGRIDLLGEQPVIQAEGAETEQAGHDAIEDGLERGSTLAAADGDGHGGPEHADRHGADDHGADDADGLHDLLHQTRGDRLVKEVDTQVIALLNTPDAQPETRDVVDQQECDRTQPAASLAEGDADTRRENTQGGKEDGVADTGERAHERGLDLVDGLGIGLAASDALLHREGDAADKRRELNRDVHYRGKSS